MDWIKKNYNLALLILALLILLFLAFSFYTKKQALNDEYQIMPANVKNNLPPTNTQRAIKDIENLNNGTKWTRPVITMPNNTRKNPALFVSTPIVIKDGETIDLQEPEPKLRPPIENWWLLQHDLEYLHRDVLDLDPDNDGFTNIEEFAGTTDPKDGANHPPLHHKLRLAKLFAYPYDLQLSGIIDQDYQIKRRKPTPQRNWFVKIDDSFGEDSRFKALKFTKKEVFSNVHNINENKSELQIYDNKYNKKHTLVYNQVYQIPYYKAKLDYLIDGSSIEVYNGDSFTLPNDDTNTAYTFVSFNIETSQLNIRYTDPTTGKEFLYTVPTKDK